MPQISNRASAGFVSGKILASLSLGVFAYVAYASEATEGRSMSGGAAVYEGLCVLIF